LGQEFTIKSEAIESKINQLLPTQGGFQPGVDFSASTMIMPIVDLTETASGSSLRADLQTAVSNNTTNVEVANTTTTVINTTGFYQVTYNLGNRSGSAQDATFAINDGSADKTIRLIRTSGSVNNENGSFVIFLSSGYSFKVTSTAATFLINVQYHQIADLAGNLTNPALFV